MKFWTLICFALVMSSCGVKGRPQPPLQPPEIGRGEPSYKKAGEDISFPDAPAEEDEEEREDEP